MAFHSLLDTAVMLNYQSSSGLISGTKNKKIILSLYFIRDYSLACCYIC